MPIPELPRADGTVRVAVPGDAEMIAAIQADTLRIGYRVLLPQAAVESFDLEVAAAQWKAAIETPPSRRHRVFVALDLTSLVGFAATSPPTDDDLQPETDAELLAFHIAPGKAREGHGSRLMAAVVDHARDDGVTRLVTWVFAADDPMRLFLRANGWDADGSTRDLDVGELVHQVRLHTGLTDPPDLIA
jgi:GNAT superfamily N-acetyltransferase